MTQSAQERIEELENAIVSLIKFLGDHKTVLGNSFKDDMLQSTTNGSPLKVKIAAP